MSQKTKQSNACTVAITGSAIAFSLAAFPLLANAATHTPTLSVSKQPVSPKKSFKNAFDLAQTDTATPSGPDVNTQLDLAFWNAIKDSDNPGLYSAYLKKFPNGNFVIIAEEKLKALGGSPQPKPTNSDGQEQPEPVDNGQDSADQNNDGQPDSGGDGPPQGSTITENGIGPLNAKTAFTIKAVSNSFDGLKFKKVKRQNGGATVFVAKTGDAGKIIVMGATKTVYSIITNASMFTDPNEIRVGDTFSKVASKIKLDQCLVNPFPETFDRPARVACFNQNSNLAYWFKVKTGKNKRQISPSKISPDALVTNLQWAATATENSNGGEGGQAKSPEDNTLPMPKETQNTDDGGGVGQPQNDRSAENNGSGDNQPADNKDKDIGSSSGGGGAGNSARQLIARGDDIMARARAEGGNKNRAAAKAFKIYIKAQRQGSARASYKIGLLYQGGFGGPDAGRRARQFFTKAGRAGYSPGFVTLVRMLDSRGKPKPAANVLLLFFRTNPDAAIDSLRRYSKRVLRAMQLKLRNTGYYRGPLDADIGQGTQAAIRAYSRAKGARRKPLPNQGQPRADIERPSSTTILIKRAQRQFRRLRCYSGPIDGIWGSGSARAARNFNRWTNGPRISEQVLSRRTLRILINNRRPVCGVD